VDAQDDRASPRRHRHVARCVTRATPRPSAWRR
jgi:hypothetical protein